MSWYTRSLKQTAVYWGSPETDGRGGHSYSAAAEISVRWEDMQELFIDPNGDELLSASVVFVNQDLDVGGYLFLGEEADLDSDHSDPEAIQLAREIKQFAKIPDLKNKMYTRKVWLR